MKKQFLCLLTATLVLAISCKREPSVLERGVEYTGPIEVTFNNYDEGFEGGTSYKKSELTLKDSLQDANVEVKLSNTTDVAPEDIFVYLTKVDAIVSDFNTRNGYNLTTLTGTTDALSFDFSKPVVIKKGTRKTNIGMKVNPGKFDLSKTSAIGIGILRVEGAGATIGNSKRSRVVVEFGARNKYDGVYQLRGFHNRPTLDAPYDEEVHMITTGPNSVQMYWPALPGLAHPLNGGVTYYSNFTTEFFFDASNRLTRVDNPYTPGSPPFTVGPATTSRWQPSATNPSVGNIYAQYYYNANLQRMFTDTLIYKGGR